MNQGPLNRHLHRLFPPQPFISPRDKVFSALGAFLGILGLSWITLQLTPTLTPLLVASMGASAVLLFAAPHSPLAQPWPFVGGNLLSAVIGVACAKTIPDPTLAGATAVSLAILAMSLLHCLHPPGGATALTAVIGGEAVHELGFGFVLMPVSINVIALLLLTLLFNRWLSPERQHAPTPSLPPTPVDPQAIAAEDMEYALKEIGSGFGGAEHVRGCTLTGDIAVGSVPAWSDEPKTEYSTINARAETIPRCLCACVVDHEKFLRSTGARHLFTSSR